MHRNGVSPVETQNLASPVEPIAIHAHNKALTILDLPTCETQDFASLLLAGSGMRLRFFPCMYAKFCVSRRLYGNIRTVISLFRHFVLSLYKISFGSAVSNLVKLRFPNLLLHSPCIIFVHRINCTQGNRDNPTFLSFALLFYISHCSLPYADLPYAATAATYSYNYELYRLFR